MERKITILRHFFEDPTNKFSIRGLSKLVDINHTTVRQHLQKLEKEGFLLLKKEGVYSYYSLILNKKTLNLKLYYNLEKIRKTGIIESLEREYDFPVIVLFGGYAVAMDDKKSDIDLCIITNIKKDFSTERYEKELNRKVSFHKFTKQEWEDIKKSNPNLVNSICNGIVLSGELEVL